MTRILLASHSPTLTTGYGRVVRMLCQELRKNHHDVVVLGLGYDGRPHDLPVNILPVSSDFASGISQALSTRSFDVLLTVGDPWMFPGVPELLRSSTPRIPWCAYFPVDGFPLPGEWKRWIARVDVPVVFSAFAQRVVFEGTGISPAVVYHGVDRTVFKPTDVTSAKQRVGVTGKFVVGCVAANQARKNLPALVKAFARFAQGKPDVILYLHTPLLGNWDIGELVERFGVEPKTRLTVGLDPLCGVPDETLVTIYNSFDVFVLPTMAEGFGLPLVEARACGVPVLATDYSACPELLPDPWQRLKVKDLLILSRNVEQALVDEDDLTGKLNTLYHDSPMRSVLRAAGFDARTLCEWSHTTRILLDLIDRAAGT